MPTTKSPITKSATTKKSVAKRVAKKTGATKKVAIKARAVAPKSLVYADNQTSFWVSNGEILNSLLALRDAFARMEREVYAEHVSANHNDFANWVEVVLCDGACAHELRAAKTPAAAKTVVVRYLKSYSL